MQAGPYVLLEELGRGASGVVYRGRGPRGQPVALKVLAAQTPEVLERFQRETRLHERLGEEAGFVLFLDMGLAEGKPYLVMPLLTGGTLRERLRQGPLGLDEALAVGERLATALGRAHALGIVHRDVKPENIIFDAAGQPFLADLGLAKHFRHDVTGASQSVVLSRAGEVRGTVSYMPPEQLEDSKSSGPPADVFALGAVLYECLSGQPAFSGATQLELLVRVAEADHVPLRKLCECPAWLSSLVETCLAADPRARPAQGQNLAEALRAGPRRSARSPWALGGLALLALGAALAWGATRPPGTQPQDTPSDSAPPASATPLSNEARGLPLGSFPDAWSPFLGAKHLRLEAAWRPPGVSRAAALSLGAEGLAVVGDERVFLLSDGPPVALALRLPVGAHATTLPQSGHDGDVLVSLEDTRLRVSRLESGGLQSEVALERPGDLATLADAARVSVVAHGSRLSLYDALPPPGMGIGNPNFATLSAPPSALVGGQLEVLAAHGSTVSFLPIRGGTTPAERSFDAPVVALCISPGGGEILVATRDGRLHCHDGARMLRGYVETGLDSPRLLCAAERLAAIAGAQELVLVDLEARGVLERLDLRGLGSEIAGLALSRDGAGLALGTSDGQVLLFSIPSATSAPGAALRPRAAWGDPAGRHAGALRLIAVRAGRLLSGDAEGALHVWDPASGAALRSIRIGSRRAPPAYTLNHAGDRVWIREAYRLREFDVATGHELRRLPRPKSHSIHAALREDDLELAVLGFAGDVEVWDLERGQRRFSQPVKRREDTPSRVGLLPSGQLLLGMTSGALLLVELDGSMAWSRSAGPKRVASLEVLPGGERALVATDEGSVTCWSLPAGEELLRFQTEPLSSLALSGQRILLGHQSGALELRDATSGTQLWSRPGAVGALPLVALASPSEALVGGASGRVRRLALADDPALVRELWPAAETPRPVLAFGFRPGRSEQITSVEAGRLRTWSTQREPWEESFADVKEARWGRAGFVAIGGAPGPPDLASWRFDAADRLESTRVSGEAPRPFVGGGRGEDGQSFVLSGDGRVVAYKGSSQGRPGFNVVFLEAGKRQFLPVRGVPTLSERGELFAIGGGGQVQVWSTAEARLLQQRIRSASRRLRFVGSSSPLLLVLDPSGRIRVFDAGTGQERGEFTPRPEAPSSLTPDPLGGRAALVFPDGSLELWSLSQGERLARLLPQAESDAGSDLPLQVAFSSEGTRLAVATGRGRFLIYEVPR